MSRSRFNQIVTARYEELEIPPEDRNPNLAEEMELEALERSHQLAGPDQPGEEYLAKVARLTAARRQAEEMVISEMLPQPPEDWVDPGEGVAEPPAWPTDPTHRLNDEEYVATLTDEQIQEQLKAWRRTPAYRAADQAHREWEERRNAS